MSNHTAGSKLADQPSRFRLGL